MPLLAVLLVAVQISFAIHAVRTGRETFWIYIIVFIPAIGCAVYFATQVLPELGQSRTVRTAGKRLVKAVDPQRELRRRKDQLEISDTVENRLKLADECMEANLIADAVDLYESCLREPHEGDPHIMLRLAKAQFLADRFAEARSTLDRLIELNPDFRSADGHLLYARVLEELDLMDGAIAEYDTLVASYPGEEARVRYALLLRNRGKSEQSKALFEEVMRRARQSPPYYRKREKEWIQVARNNLG